MVILDPQSGQILAAVGDITAGGQGNSLNAHPAGTAITPFIYLTGFSRGLNPASLAWDIPSALPVPGQVYHGPVRLRTALANDYLPPAQSVLSQMGLESVQNIAASFGLDLPAGLLVDDFDLSPVALAGAYGIFANNGTQAGQTLASAVLQPAALLKVSGVDHSIWADWTVPAKPGPAQPAAGLPDEPGAERRDRPLAFPGASQPARDRAPGGGEDLPRPWTAPPPGRWAIPPSG